MSQNIDTTTEIERQSRKVEIIDAQQDILTLLSSAVCDRKDIGEFVREHQARLNGLRRDAIEAIYVARNA